MPVSAGPTTSMIGQSELSIFEKSDFRQKGWHQDSSKTICVSFFRLESIKYPCPIKASKALSWCRRWSPPPAPRRHPLHHHWQPRVLASAPQVWKAQKGLDPKGDKRFQAIKFETLPTFSCAKNDPGSLQQKKMK